MLLQAIAAVSCTEGLPDLASLQGHATQAANQTQQPSHPQDSLVHALMQRLGGVYQCLVALLSNPRSFDRCMVVLTIASLDAERSMHCCPWHGNKVCPVT